MGMPNKLINNNHILKEHDYKKMINIYRSVWKNVIEFFKHMKYKRESGEIIFALYNGEKTEKNTQAMIPNETKIHSPDGAKICAIIMSTFKVLF